MCRIIYSKIVCIVEKYFYTHRCFYALSFCFVLFFPMSDAVSVKDLFSNQVHIGHRPERWNPRMKDYVYGKKDGVYLLDLEKSVKQLESAIKFLKAVKLQGKTVLFVGTKPQAQLVIQQNIAPSGHFFVDRKWTPGLLTNFSEIRKRIDHYLDLKSQFESGEINKYTKKEVAVFKKELDKLDASFSGIAQMRKRPDVLIALDAVSSRLAIDESKQVGIGVIALADVNADPEGIDYLIPANDDSIKSIRFLVGKMLESV